MNALTIPSDKALRGWSPAANAARATATLGSLPQRSAFPISDVGTGAGTGIEAGGPEASMALTDDDLPRLNEAFAGASADQIVAWAATQEQPMILSSSMGQGSAVMLHLVSIHAPDTPVVWVDTGYNSADTYRFAEEVRERLGLKLHVYSPMMTTARWEALHGPVPFLDEPERHAAFTRAVKLEPFERAMEHFQPKLWLSGIRREETEHRRSLNVLSRDPRGMLKVAPIFHWSESDLDAYLKRHDLPDNPHYFDPTKVEAGRECGLHVAA